MGEADQGALQTLAQALNGSYHFTKSSKKLSQIYDDISDQVKAVYSLTYVSDHPSSADTLRPIAIQFPGERVVIRQVPFTYPLPGFVVEQLRQQEVVTRLQILEMNSLLALQIKQEAELRHLKECFCW